MPTKGTLISVLLHIAATALLFLLGYAIPPVVRTPTIVRDAVRLIPNIVLSPRRGGGDRSPEQPRRGQPPSRPLRRVFAPTLPRIEEPKLPLELAMLDAPPEVRTGQAGDPFSQLAGGWSGRDGLLGIGRGPGSNVGAGPGGANSGGVPVARPRITRPPEVLYHPEPEYSDEARKVRFQGSVMLSIVVGIDGKASQIRVVREAGLGLDERAVEAVTRWRFRPAVAGDRAVPAPALIEVTFHLL